MAYYGPKTVSAKGDTVYYSVPEVHLKKCKTTFKVDNVEGGEFGHIDSIKTSACNEFEIDTVNYPVYIILFLDPKLKKEGYKLEAFFDYAQYKPSEFKNVPMFFISDYESALRKDLIKETELHGDFDSLKINLPSFHPLLAEGKTAKEAYFKGKPYYVFDYFAVLVDKHRHIRGYYDPNQNSEVKRLIQEYKHLKTKDEYANTLDQNNIGKK